jgi:hypothetical protein
MYRETYLIDPTTNVLLAMDRWNKETAQNMQPFRTVLKSGLAKSKVHMILLHQLAQTPGMKVEWQITPFSHLHVYVRHHQVTRLRKNLIRIRSGLKGDTAVSPKENLDHFQCKPGTIVLMK